MIIYLIDKTVLNSDKQTFLKLIEVEQVDAIPYSKIFQ
jgi:hypothetical protein